MSVQSHFLIYAPRFVHDQQSLKQEVDAVVNAKAVDCCMLKSLRSNMLVTSCYSLLGSLSMTV